MAELEARLDKSVDLFKKGASTVLPTRWKSLATGQTTIVSLDGDHLYLETVISDQKQKEAGGFLIAELKRSGDSYLGVIRGSWVCTYQANDWSTLGKKTVWNRCTQSHPIEVTSLTPTRIEGYAPTSAGLRFDCKKCAYSGPLAKGSFTWIPE
jgi:hypothetical protein